MHGIVGTAGYFLGTPLGQGGSQDVMADDKALAEIHARLRRAQPYQPGSPLDGRHWFMPPDGPVWSKPSAAAAPPQPAPLSYSNEKPNMPTPHVSSVEVL